MRSLFVLTLVLSLTHVSPARGQEFAAGWLPIQNLDAKKGWDEVRKIDDKVQLYLPQGVKTYRGVFVCYVFHSQDPRQLADLWEFALVTVPTPFEYDLGYVDKRNPRLKLGHPVGNMGFLLKYLDLAAKETRHSELAVAPLVGWLGQNGSTLCNDLWKRAPDRVVAWTDSFPNWLAKFPELSANVPFAFAWEFSPKDEKDRAAEREAKLPAIQGKPTPPPDLKARANTYGFAHGIYSKYNYFAAYLDRCIAVRLPDATPPAGQPVKLKPWKLENGWAGDFNPVGEWNPIAPVKEANGMVDPQWFPDAYAAWTWRAYHTAKPDLKITAPIVEYHKGGDRKDSGFGFAEPLAPGTVIELAAAGTAEYAKVEFRSGDKLLGTAEKAPWKIDSIKVERGLHALHAIGTKADGTKSSSRAAFLLVK